MSYNIVSLDGYITISRALKIYDTLINSGASINHNGQSIDSCRLSIPRNLGADNCVISAMNLERLLNRHNSTIEKGSCKLMRYMVNPHRGFLNHRIPAYAIRFINDDMTEFAPGSAQDIPLFIGSEFAYMVNPFATDVASAIKIVCETSLLLNKQFDPSSVPGEFELELNTIGFEIHRLYSEVNSYTHLPDRFCTPATFTDLLNMFGAHGDDNERAIDEYLSSGRDNVVFDFLPIEIKFSDKSDKLLISRIRHEGAGAGKIVERMDVDNNLTPFDTVMLKPSELRTAIFKLDADVYYRDENSVAVFSATDSVTDENINNDEFYHYLTKPLISAWEIDECPLAGGEASVASILGSFSDNIEILADKSLRAIKKIPGLPVDVYKWMAGRYKWAIKAYTKMKQDSDLDFQDAYLNDEVYPFLEHTIMALKTIFVAWFGFLMIGPLSLILAVLTWIKNKDDYERAKDLVVKKMVTELEVADKEIQKAESEGDSKKVANWIRFKHRLTHTKDKIVSAKFEQMMR